MTEFGAGRGTPRFSRVRERRRRILPGAPAPHLRTLGDDQRVVGRRPSPGRTPLLLVLPGPISPCAAAVLTAFEQRTPDFAHRSVQVLGVVECSMTELRELADRLPLASLTVLADDDGALTRAYEAREEPRYVLIDRAGLVFRSFGHDPAGGWVEHALVSCDALLHPPVLP
jgi:peroxiredoxin